MPGIMSPMTIEITEEIEDGLLFTFDNHEYRAESRDSENEWYVYRVEPPGQALGHARYAGSGGFDVFTVTPYEDQEPTAKGMNLREALEWIVSDGPESPAHGIG